MYVYICSRYIQTSTALQARPMRLTADDGVGKETECSAQDLSRDLSVMVAPPREGSLMGTLNETARL